MESLFETQKVFSVKELNSAALAALKERFSSRVWVAGEIQGLSEKNGNCYFDLVEKDPKGDTIIAKVASVMWASVKAAALRRLKEADSSLEIRNDIEVKLLCEVDLYVPWGKFSIKVCDIDPVYTLGKVAQNRLKIIEDLKKRGLLEKNKLLTVPEVPLNIGLITSFDSAAYHDFVNELKVNGYGFKVWLRDCRMQGEQTEGDIVAALESFNRQHQDLFDVLVITRGGGAISDLAWFDSKKIAEAIAVSKFPVITAIGHQINQTISDLVAHTSLKTPTASAQFLVSRVQEFVQKLTGLQDDILEEAQTIIDDQTSCLQGMAVKIETFTSRYFRTQAEDLLDKKHILQSVCQRIVMQGKQEIARAKDSLNNSANKIFEKSKDKIKYLESKISLLDPKNVLRRGFSLTLKDGKALKSASGVDIGSKIETIFYDGKITSRVEEKEHNMAKKEIKYSEAMEELNGILEGLQSDSVDVDEVSVKVKRAVELIKVAREKIEKTEFEVKKIVKEFDAEQARPE